MGGTSLPAGRPPATPIKISKLFMEEYFDIVDENGIPTGEIKSRREAHSKGLWHRTVHIYVFRKSSERIEFLVHLRSKRKDLNLNKWDTRFGGHLKAGETVEDAVEGELQDEIGLTADPANLISGGVGKSDQFPNREFVNTFYYNFKNDISTLKFNDGEVQEIKWLSSSEILKSMADKPNIWTGSDNGFSKILSTLKSKLHPDF